MATVTIKPDGVEFHEHKATGASPVARPVRVLIVFNTVSLYGIERQVIKSFDLLQPEVEPHFLSSYTTYCLQLHILAEIERRGLALPFQRPHGLAQDCSSALAAASLENGGSDDQGQPRLAALLSLI